MSKDHGCHHPTGEEGEGAVSDRQERLQVRAEPCTFFCGMSCSLVACVTAAEVAAGAALHSRSSNVYSVRHFFIAVQSITCDVQLPSDCHQI